ncbi:MAG: HAD-IG family 5'-nucleotidase [Oligoflexales bacterium]
MSSLKLKKWQRIFVNRSLNMASIKSIGFDMDHTLAPYNRASFEALAFSETLKKFIHNGYPEELSKLQFDPNFVIRGLLVDIKRGNLLKVDAHKYVKIAFHGRESLSKEMRHELYNSESFKADTFLSIDTFFALSEVQLFTEIVDYMRLNPGKIKKSFHEVYADLRKYIDLSHADGSIKNQVMKDPGSFINKDKYRVQTLVRLLEGGKNLFLLTNSHWEYTNFIMSYLYNDTLDAYASWRDYFEYIFVGTGKPNFFTGAHPFYEVQPDTGLLKPHSGVLSRHTPYHGGNATLFQELTGQKGDEILYMGDHIYTDIIRSKGLFNWRTLLVVEELDSELPKLEKIQPEIKKIQDLLSSKEIYDENAQRIRSRIASNRNLLKIGESQNDKKRVKSIQRNLDSLAKKLEYEESQIREIERVLKDSLKTKEKVIHPIWGELMHVGLEKSRFAKQVEEYACLYTARVSNLGFYSPFKKYTSPHDLMPHDL